MDSTNGRQPEREVQWAHARRDELVERIARALREDGTAEPLPGLMLRRASAPTELGHGVSFPAWCVIAQGSKEILLGDTLCQLPFRQGSWELYSVCAPVQEKAL